MKVCICEKPSVAKDIAKVLGAKDIKDGYYEGNGYQVTWTFGHLCELKMPEEYNPLWKRWNYNMLPIIPERFKIKVMNDSGVQKQFNTIKFLVERADEVINCGDAGQEGELIQRWVLHLCKVSCPVKRLWISSLTEKSIKEGFKKLQPAENFDSLYQAGMARSVGDWLLGINATRFYTIRHNMGKFGPLQSVGRVQTPTLAMIVERDRAIDSFQSTSYNKFSTTYRKTVFRSSKEFTDPKEAKELYNTYKDSTFRVLGVKNTDKTEKPPKMFDLTSLQVHCNNAYGYSAEDTLNTIQSLYEKKMLTYPRVDTCYLTEDVYKECPNILRQLRTIGYDYVDTIDLGKLMKRSTVFDDSKVTDHHAIIPTGYFTEMDEKERNVYDDVAKRFICNFYGDYKYAETVVIGTCQIDGNSWDEFKTTGRTVQDLGFYEVLGTTPNDVVLPNFQEGEEGSHKLKLETINTTPPARFTEATILRAMETAGKQMEDTDIKEALKENGIGRPSTRAAIIEVLLKRGYITRDKKKLISTEAGKHLIDSIDYDTLKSARLTGEWEQKLRKIEKGEYEAKEFMEEMKSMVKTIVKK